MLPTPISARFSFLPDRAAEFIDEYTFEVTDRDGKYSTVTTQPVITQIEYATIEELMDDVAAFRDALHDCSAIVPAYDKDGNLVGRVVNLSDFEDEIDD